MSELDVCVPATRFPFVAGAICLDLVNTLDGARGRSVREQLCSYADLVEWSRQAGLFSDAEAERLRQEAPGRAHEATAVLERARNLREAIYRIFSPLAAGEQPAPADLAILNGELGQGLLRARIVPASGGFTWGWSQEEIPLDAMLGPIARSAADLLISGTLPRVRECDSDRCTWLFVDETKNHSRRWCDMKTCGNTAKVRRHRSRQHCGEC